MLKQAFRFIPFLILASYTNAAPLLPQNHTVTCESTVFLYDAQNPRQNQFALKNKPENASETIATLQKGQYACVIRTKDTGWLLLKAVKPHNAFNMNFADGNDPATKCHPTRTPETCVSIKNYPIKWAIETPKGKSCVFKSKLDGENWVFRASGVCATGWVPESAAFYFAD